jgi:Asp-tRNA(Asn)/Glu-tRNA(Gln) amidotransferase A subunit family amidase
MLRELAGAVREGRVSARELAERALARIAAIDPKVNAVTAVRPVDEVFTEADRIDGQVRRGEEPGPLAGVPFLVKDIHDLAGMPTRLGCLLLADAPPATEDSLSVARLRAAGAVPVAKSAVPEYCFEGYTASELTGETLNPWGLAWSPGGSSGGSAAAMAAGMIPFGTSTDGGGSARIPASFCGLFGMKPTNGLVPRDRVPEWIDFSTDGAMGLTMDDVRLQLSLLAGPVAGDPTALPSGWPSAWPTAATSAADWSSAAGTRPSLVLAAPRAFDWGPLPGPVADLFAAALTVLERDLGLTVEPVSPRELLPEGDVDDDWLTMAACEHAHALGAEWLAAAGDRLTRPFAAALHLGFRVRLEEYLAARRRRFDYVRFLDRALGDDRVLVMPTMTVVGFTADGREVGHDEPGTDGASYNTQVQNITGHPSLTVPGGVSPNGIPFGLLITGPRFRDDLVLAVGDAWERIHPTPGVAPGFAPFWPD